MAAPDVPDDFRETLRALQARYAAELPERLAAIEAALADPADPNGRDGHERARALVHRLRGTAGSYGFAAISEAAARLEDALDAAPADPAAVSSAHDALRAVAAAACPPS